VGGQHSLRRLWQSYYASCHAIVFVIDSTDLGAGVDVASAAGIQAEGGDAPKSAGAVGGTKNGDDLNRLDECKLVLEDVLAHEGTEGVPLLVLANKQDREDCVEVVAIKEGLVRRVFEGERGGSVRDSRVLPLSALTGTGVKEAVEWLCSRVKWNREARPAVMR